MIVQAHDPKAGLEFANPPVIDAWEKNAREKVALTVSHVGHGGHVPATNILVERNRILEHCTSPTHATSNTKRHTINKRTRPDQSSKRSSNGFTRGSEQGK